MSRRQWLALPMDNRPCTSASAGEPYIDCVNVIVRALVRLLEGLLYLEFFPDRNSDNLYYEALVNIHLLCLFSKWMCYFLGTLECSY